MRRPDQTIISGMGELHLEIIVDRMMREFKVDANIGRPQVAYRETIRKEVEKVEGKFMRQSGRSRPVRSRRDQPGAAGARRRGSVFEDKIVGGVMPREYIGPTEQGIKRSSWRTACSPAIRWWTSRSELIYGSLP
jgi:elongation factor G